MTVLIKEDQLQTITSVILEIVRPSAPSVVKLAIKQEIAKETGWLLVRTLNQLDPVMSVETKIKIKASAQSKTKSKVEMLLVKPMQSEMSSRAKGEMLLRVVHIPVKNKMLVAKGNSGMSRLKVISCIKVRKYIERRCQLFLAQIMEKEPTKRRLEDVPVIRDFLKVFPDDLLGLPPPRQVKFRIEILPGAAPVVRAPYRLVPPEMKELSDQLKELSEKGFIRPSSSPWGALVLFV
nr:putative reverse transcriptase domain-containing protein [Tanacetum cinerariifolium]